MRLLVVLLTVLLAGVAAGCGEGDEDDVTADASALEGAPWVLVSGVDVEGWEEVAPSATFENGSVSGSNGCNRYTGPYTIDGSSVELGQLAMTQMACVSPAAEVEQQYMAALQKVTGWELDDAELVLTDENGDELLRFEQASIGGQWKLTGYLEGTGFRSLIAGTEVTADFGPDGKLSGSAGCNTYTADYSAADGEVEITPPGATRMACGDPEGVMQQEATYLALLPEAVTYRLDGRSLELLREDGTRILGYTRDDG